MEFSANFTRIDSAIEDGFREAAKQLNDAIYDAIDAPIYDWPRGESPRDIVDTRELQNKQRYEEIGYAEYGWSWDVPYVLPVFTGYVTRSGSVMPARNPVEAAMQRGNFSTVIAESIGRRM
jgi:hypothetical protein